jgi:predicted DNA-binding protein (MmcQ/YjbR family)
MGRLREICLALPETYEQETWEVATFRVASKMFVIASESDDGEVTASMKATRLDQEELLAEGEPYYYPAYVGHKGWIGLRVSSSEVVWSEVRSLVRASYCLVAPKRLAMTLQP